MLEFSWAIIIPILLDLPRVHLHIQLGRFEDWFSLAALQTLHVVGELFVQSLAFGY